VHGFRTRSQTIGKTGGRVSPWTMPGQRLLSALNQINRQITAMRGLITQRASPGRRRRSGQAADDSAAKDDHATKDNFVTRDDSASKLAEFARSNEAPAYVRAMQESVDRGETTWNAVLTGSTADAETSAFAETLGDRISVVRGAWERAQAAVSRGDVPCGDVSPAPPATAPSPAAPCQAAPSPAPPVARRRRYWCRVPRKLSARTQPRTPTCRR